MVFKHRKSKRLSTLSLNLGSLLAEMVSASENICVILLHVEIVLGILGNVFIILVNCIDWFKKRKVSLTDRLLTALAIARIFLMLMMSVEWFMTEFYSSLHISKQKTMVMYIALTIANHFSVWLATALSIFYFLKIAIFSNPVFIYLRHRAKMVVLIIILGTLVLLPFILGLASIYVSIQTQLDEKNTTLSFKRNDIENLVKLTIFTLESIVPFAISLKFLLLLVFSLWKHLKNVKINTEGFRNASFQVHVTAIKIVVSFFFLFATYFLISVVITFYYETFKNKFVLMLILGIAAAYPSVHSWILILGNHKLRKASLSLMWLL